MKRWIGVKPGYLVCQGRGQVSIRFSKDDGHGGLQIAERGVVDELVLLIQRIE